MYFDGGFDNDSGARGPSIWTYLSLVVAGVLIGGGLMLLMLFSLFPADFGAEEPGNQARENSQEENSAEEPEQDIVLPAPEAGSVINAVGKVSPAVVGVVNYGQQMRFGQTVMVEQGTGSGVVISSDGLVVTNHHVVERAEEIEIVFKDRSAASARVIGEDPETDMAVLEVETEENLDYAEIARDTQNLVPGQTAIAIGNPLGLELQQTVTTGVISAVERQITMPGSQFTYTYIQTDAAINEGNSGGPLVNLEGEVIGINSAKIGGAGVEGIGFAIPGRTVHRVARDISEHGAVRRPNMGVYITDYSDVTGDRTDTGVYVDRVVRGSPAEEAGLRSGDVIVEVDGHTIDYYAQLFDILLDYYPGDTVEVAFERNGERMSEEVTLGEAD